MACPPRLRNVPQEDNDGCGLSFARSLPCFPYLSFISLLRRSSLRLRRLDAPLRAMLRRRDTDVGDEGCPLPRNTISPPCPCQGLFLCFAGPVVGRYATSAFMDATVPNQVRHDTNSNGNIGAAEKRFQRRCGSSAGAQLITCDDIAGISMPQT